MDKDLIADMISAAEQALLDAKDYLLRFNNAPMAGKCLNQARADIETAIEEGEKCAPLN